VTPDTFDKLQELFRLFDGYQACDGNQIIGPILHILSKAGRLDASGNFRDDAAKLVRGKECLGLSPANHDEIELADYDVGKPFNERGCGLQFL
jgi:hypothetical protein